MDIEEYTKFVNALRWYHGAGTGGPAEYAYLGLGIAGEAGELVEDVEAFLQNAIGISKTSGKLADLIKKMVREPHENFPEVLRQNHMSVTKELGDLMWYVVALCTVHNVKLDTVLTINAAKLAGRMRAMGKISDDDIVAFGIDPLLVEDDDKWVNKNFLEGDKA